MVGPAPSSASALAPACLDPDASGTAQTAALAAVALQAARGGGDDWSPAAFFRTEQAPTKRILAAEPVVAAPAPTVSELLD
jgi:hypothetical protein